MLGAGFCSGNERGTEDSRNQCEALLAAGSPPPAPGGGPPSLAVAPSRVGQCWGLRMRSLSGACHQVLQGLFPCHTTEVWLAGSGQRVGGYYVSISLIVSKSLGKQEGISLKEFDPGFFGSLSSNAGSADCSKKSRLFLSPREVIFFWEWRPGWEAEGLIEQGPPLSLGGSGRLAPLLL